MLDASKDVDKEMLEYISAYLTVSPALNSTSVVVATSEEPSSGVEALSLIPTIGISRAQPTRSFSLIILFCAKVMRSADGGPQL